MTTREGPRSGYSEGRHDDPTRIPPPCRNRADCERVRVKAACWDDLFTPEAVAARLEAEDRAFMLRIRQASLDVSGAWEEWRRARREWWTDVTVPDGFYGTDWPEVTP
jgi:hypothetical protein